MSAPCRLARKPEDLPTPPAFLPDEDLDASWEGGSEPRHQSSCRSRSRFQMRSFTRGGEVDQHTREGPARGPLWRRPRRSSAAGCSDMESRRASAQAQVPELSVLRLPILISGYTAIAIAHVIYEVLHAVHHQPYELFWKPRLEHPIFGGAWAWLYGFHQAHHANYRCNINVAGFFGIPLADLVFGTYRRPSPLLLDGARATKADARRLLPQPRWPVSWFDRIVFKRRRWMVRRP